MRSTSSSRQQLRLRWVSSATGGCGASGQAVPLAGLQGSSAHGSLVFYSHIIIISFYVYIYIFYLVQPVVSTREHLFASCLLQADSGSDSEGGQLQTLRIGGVVLRVDGRGTVRSRTRHNAGQQVGAADTAQASRWLGWVGMPSEGPGSVLCALLLSGFVRSATEQLLAVDGYFCC